MSETIEPPETLPTPRSPGDELLAGYRVAEHLARGKTLDVYSVASAERGCLCVAKTLRPDRAGDTTAAERLLTEGTLMQQLTHPHLVRGYETHTDPLPVVIMETLAGQTLSHLITSRPSPLPTGEPAELGCQLTSALGYLHRHGLLHLDLKPSNVVASAGLARLIDLSHARPPGPCPAGFGTREYMPPEQLRGGEVSTASDVYGLGGVLFRATTRHRPFRAADRDTTPDQPTNLTPLRQSTDLPAELVGIITGCLDPHPARRPSLPEITDLFEELIRRVGPPRPDDQSSPPPIPPKEEHDHH
jgi:serine/threonine protein kinase